MQPTSKTAAIWRAARGKRSGWRKRIQSQGEVGLEEPEPVSPGKDAVERCRRGAGAPCPAAGESWAGAEAEHPVGDDRVAAAQPRLESLRIVVGKLVDHDEGPHLHRVQRHVAFARARGENSDRQGPRGTGSHRHRSGHSQPLAQQGHGHRSRHSTRRSGTYGEAKRRRWPRSRLHQVGEYRSAAERRARRRAAPRD